MNLAQTFAALALAALSGLVAARGDLTRHVDPFIGTDGTGHVTPAAMVPFGMVAPGPDNADRGWSYSSGYQYRAPRILGFSNTHISGAGIPELGDVLLMPAAGTRWAADSTDFSAAPAKKTEHARPGVYRVTLPRHGVRVELTATQRVAVHRYTFDEPGSAQVLVDLQHGLLFGDGERVTRAESRVDAARGEVTGTTHSKNWVEREASFIVRFDRPIARVTTLPLRAGDKAARYVLDFDLAAGRVLYARVALSTVDVEARAATWRWTRPSPSTPCAPPPTRSGRRCSRASRSMPMRASRPSSTRRCTARCCTPATSPTPTAACAAPPAR